VARKTFSKELKARVALEARRGEKTVAQLSSEYGVHATPINDWKKPAREGLPELFERGRSHDAPAQEAEKEPLYPQIGTLQVEVEWLREKSKQLGLT